MMMMVVVVVMMMMMIPLSGAGGRCGDERAAKERRTLQSGKRTRTLRAP